MDRQIIIDEFYTHYTEAREHLRRVSVKVNQLEKCIKLLRLEFEEAEQELRDKEN